MTKSSTGRLTVSDIAKTFGPPRFAAPVLKHCSFSIEPGRFTVLIGPSGCGKTTLIRLIAGYDRPDAGEIRLDGRKICGPGRDRLVVFQESALFPWMTTRENILFGPRARGENPETSMTKAESLLERVGLKNFARNFPGALSGGMQRRAELARALINAPDLMLLDEPFRGLDALSKKLMLDYYATLSAEQGRTNLFATTDIDEAIFLADRLLIMGAAPGRIRAEIDVDLPRPRKLIEIFADERANAIKIEALSLLHEEAVKNFGGARKASSDFVEAYRRRLSAGA